MRILLSYACYWMGDAVSRLPDAWFSVWDPAYNRLMLWSSNLQCDDPRGPWLRVIEDGRDA